ncbi:MAG: sugar transferase, partial [Actinobacteria bacterium]|nr:sugar transferase [Actinomycetota bacterium]
MDTHTAQRTSPTQVRVPASVQFTRLARAMAFTDLMSIVAGFSIASLMRFGFVAPPFDLVAVVVVAPPIFLLVMAAFRLYQVYRMAAAEEFRRVFFAVTICITAVGAVSFWTKAELSRLWVGYSWVAIFLLLLIVRRLWHHAIFKAQRRGTFSFRTLVIGSNDEAAHVAGVMSAIATGFSPVGFVSTTLGGADMGQLHDAGAIGDLEHAVEETDAECLFVASSALGEGDMATATRVARANELEVRVSANIPEMFSTRLSAQPFGGLMAFSVWPVRLSGMQSITKRTFDLVVGAIVFVIALPFCLMIALAVKLSSKGPVVFRQERVGRRGRTFTLLKFRTMREGMPKPDNDAEGPLFKAREDPRVTGVGGFLRRWSMDELPQLLNVLRGDMSLVGPRPPLAAEVAAYSVWQRERLEVRPGITGLWQVSGRSELSFDDYVRLDLFYIENWSLAYDLFLLL